MLAAPNSGLLNQAFRALTGAESDDYLFNIYSLPGTDLRHLLLHVPLRVRAGRQCARPHAGRSRGCLVHSRRRCLDDGAPRHHSARHAGAAGGRAGRVPASDDAVRLAGDPGAAGRLPHHDDQDLEPVPVSAEARTGGGRIAAAAAADHPAAARAETSSSAGAAIRWSAAGRAIRGGSRCGGGAGRRSPSAFLVLLNPVFLPYGALLNAAFSPRAVAVRVGATISPCTTSNSCSSNCPRRGWRSRTP